MIELQEVSVVFPQKGGALTAVQKVNLQVEKGDIFGIVGYSGAGKSTLVRVMNLLQRPSSGKVWVAGTELTALSEKNCEKSARASG